MSRLLAVALLAGCALDNQLADGGPRLDFMIGSIAFHVASGGAWLAGTTLTLYLTDQPDACLAIAQVPVGRATYFSLRVLPGGGTTVLGPGQGDIHVQTGVVKDASYDVADGTVTWAMNADGSYSLGALDAGFSGASARLQVANLTLQACPHGSP